jgi:PleD family two-component response regulator
MWDFRSSILPATRHSASYVGDPGSDSVGRYSFRVSVARVLVVDDFAGFRDAICSRLSNRPDLRVVAEASDGLEAVRKAEELQPDLIVLDISMPKLNGLNA